MSKNNKKVKEYISDDESSIQESEEEYIDDEDEIIEESDSEEYEDEPTEDIDENNEDCLYDKLIKDSDEYINNNPIINILEGKERISSNRLTKYEMVRILGERTKQLIMGAKPLIKNYEGLSYDKIAEEELKLNMIPFKIKRPLPNNRYEIWSLDELYKDHLLPQLD